jgi:hypothetical protein
MQWSRRCEIEIHHEGHEVHEDLLSMVVVVRACDFAPRVRALWVRLIRRGRSGLEKPITFVIFVPFVVIDSGYLL